MKKVLVVLLALAMVFSSMSFTLADESEKTHDKTLTAFYDSGHTTSEHTDKILAVIEDYLDADYEVIIGDGSSFNQQLALMATTGEMPDIVWCSFDTWYEYALEGAWADLSGYKEQYPTLFNDYLKNPELWNYMAVDGEGIYGVPSDLGFDCNNVIYVRQDWLDKLGLEQPVTLDDYTKVLYAFTNDDPDGNGENDTYGLGLNTYQFLSPFMGAFGATAAEHYFLNDDGTITTNAISDDYREALKYLATLYADGVIHPEALNNLGFGFSANWSRGEAGMWSTAWSQGAMSIVKAGFEETQPDGHMEIIDNPIGADGKNGNLFQGSFTTVVAVSAFSDPEIIDTAVKFLDWQASEDGFWTVFMGVRGEYWDYDENGDIGWSWQFNGGFTASGEPVVTVEAYKLLYHEIMQGNLYPKAYETSGLEKDRLLAIGAQKRLTQNVYDNLFKYLHCSEYAEYAADLTDYFTQSMYSFIKGELDINDDAVWQNYCDTYLNMGGDTVRNALLEMYNTLYGTDYTFA